MSRDLLVTCDGAGFSHGLIDHITALNGRPGRRVHYSAGWELGERERTAIGHVPARAWGQVLDATGQPRSSEHAGVVELTALLRGHPDGDHLATWPADLRIICRRERPHPGAQLSLFEEADGVAVPTGGHQHSRQHRPVPARPGTARTPWACSASVNTLAIACAPSCRSGSAS